MNSSCLLCRCNTADSPPGARRVKFTPKFVRPKRSPSGRFSRFAMRLKKGSGYVEGLGGGGAEEATMARGRSGLLGVIGLVRGPPWGVNRAIGPNQVQTE